MLAHGLSHLACSQAGEPVEVLASRFGAGDADVKVVYFRSNDAVTLGVEPGMHTVFIGTGRPVPMRCRTGSAVHEHLVQRGSVAVCPAGIEAAARSLGAVEGVLIRVPSEPIAVVAAEERGGAAMGTCLSGTDLQLASVAIGLAAECREGSIDPWNWRDLCDELVQHLVEAYTVKTVATRRGRLNRDEIDRLNRYIATHLDQPISVIDLADVAKRGCSQFPRIFRRTVGVNPYQYVIRVRLREALRLIRSGEMTLAEVALASGFTDQSHLTAWMRRVYGAPPGRFALATTQR